MPVGSTNLNFGPIGTPTSEAETVVTGLTTIQSGSKVEAFVRLVATADHSADEILHEQFSIYAGNIVAGVGFTVYGFSHIGTTYGLVTVDYAYT